MKTEVTSRVVTECLNFNCDQYLKSEQYKHILNDFDTYLASEFSPRQLQMLEAIVASAFIRGAQYLGSRVAEIAINGSAE